MNLMLERANAEGNRGATFTVPHGNLDAPV